MHVLVLPSWYENKSQSTLGSFFKDQATALQSLGHKIGIIYPHALSLKQPWLWQPAKTIAENKINVFSKTYFLLPKMRQYNLNKRIQQYEDLFSSYIKVHGNPDVLHAHSCAFGPNGEAGVAAFHLSKKYKIPYVITEHASAFHTGNYHPNDTSRILNAFHNASEIIAVSESLASDLKVFGVKKDINIIGNIIDTDVFYPVKESNQQTNYVFIFIGYLRKIKNIDLILKSFALSHKVSPQIRLKIVGNGVKYNYLHKLAKSLNIANSVEFLGELSKHQVAKELNESHCLVLASQYETFSVAVHEALATGISVISTNCGGPVQTVQQLQEVTINNTSEDSLSNAMLKQLKVQQNKTDKDRKHAFIHGNFSKTVIGGKLTQSLTNAIANYNKEGSDC